MKSSSNNIPKLVECTNENSNVWVVRWGIKQQQRDDEQESLQYVYQEKRFGHLPAFKEVAEAILESGEFASADELKGIITVAGEDLEVAKNLIQARIDLYDKSDAVNQLSVNGMNIWLDKQTRTSLSYTISVEEQNGIDQTTLWYEGLPPVSFTLKINQLKQMLSALELYAKETYNVTQNHKAEVCQLTTVNEVLDFDIAAGYPEKLSFTF